MTTNRLEAFSDGVIAIIITIMVLELKVPEGHDLDTLKPLFPTFLTYILSFIYLGIYWNNHHHLMHAVNKVKGGILWANLHLLFWLSLFPFATGYMGENHFEKLPTALYGVVVFMASVAWKILVIVIRKHEDKSSKIHILYNDNLKINISMLLYFLAVLISFVLPWVAGLIYIALAVFWVVPDKRLED